MMFNMRTNRISPEQIRLMQAGSAVKLEAIYKARLLPRPYKQPIQRIPARVEVRYRDGFEILERRSP